MDEEKTVTTPKTNVIPFPRQKRETGVVPTTSMEALQEAINKRVKDFLDGLSNSMMYILHDEFPRFGVNVDDPLMLEVDLPFVAAAIRSALYRQQGIPHFIQEHADAYAKSDDPDRSIMMVLTPDELEDDDGPEYA